MKGDIAFAGFMLTAEEWQALDRETRAALVATVTRKFPKGTQPPHRASQPDIYIAGGRIVPDDPSDRNDAKPVEVEAPRALAEGSGPLATDEYIDLFGDE